MRKKRHACRVFLKDVSNSMTDCTYLRFELPQGVVGLSFGL